MYRFLLTRRWVGSFLVLVLACAAMIQLGRWQLHRLEHRREVNSLVRTNQRLPPAPVDELLHQHRIPPKAVVWRRAVVTGRYDARYTWLVRNRTLGGAVGYLVLVPVVRDGAPAVLVDRGWVRAAGGGSARTVPPIPAPPAGPVTVTGRVRAGESAVLDRALPPREVVRIAPWQIARTLPYPLVDGFLELTDERPTTPDAPVPLPPPELSEGPHLAYAVQWFLFTGIAVVGWVLLVRQEAHGGRTRAGPPAGAGRPPTVRSVAS